MPAFKNKKKNNETSLRMRNVSEKESEEKEML